MFEKMDELQESEAKASKKAPESMKEDEGEEGKLSEAQKSQVDGLLSQVKAILGDAGVSDPMAVCSEYFGEDAGEEEASDYSEKKPLVVAMLKKQMGADE